MALPEPRARPLYDLESASLIRRFAYVNEPLPDEVLDWNLLDAAARIPHKPGVVDDSTVAGVDAVVPVSAPGYDEAGSRHPFVPQVHRRHFDLHESFGVGECTGTVDGAVSHQRWAR